MFLIMQKMYSSTEDCAQDRLPKTITFYNIKFTELEGIRQTFSLVEFVYPSEI